MLSSSSIKAARPRPRAYKIFDGRGLHLHVLPSGSRSFRVKFRYRGREGLITLGRFPDLALPEARARCDAIHASIERGEDPRAHGAAGGTTFEAIARAWLKLHSPRWSTVHTADVEASLVLHVFPAIGAMSIGEVDAPRVLQLLREVEARGSRATARRLRQRIASIYALAISEGHQVNDPATIVAKAMQPPASPKHHPALVELEDARALIVACDRLEAAATIKYASTFLALTTVRLAAVRGAQWREIEGVDWSTGAIEDPLWRVPAARVKLSADKKLEAAHDHLVPLSPAAIDVLRAARALDQFAGADKLIFPGRGGDRPIGEAAIGDLYARTAFAGRHVPHGWRATFSTIMNTLHRADRAEIDLTLGHVSKDKVEAAYDRATMLSQRRVILERWSAYLIGD